MTREIMVVNLIPRVLTLEITVVELFNEINKTFDNDIIVNFEGIECMNVRFAQKYNVYKRKSPKNITEINLHEFAPLMSVSANLFEY
ncbi:hypothetical protein [Methanosphaera cuniculi]|uniref:hypothetical protein n=1 Tax=Methanosphaera cuniculi TaxID=1077256 RepID=UPI0026E99BBE|nr:hypothetical protein [Methanosphaera cuniculi]